MEEQDIYEVDTPHGHAQVTFPDEEGVEFDGEPLAVDYLKTLIGQQIGSEGISLAVETLEPHDFYYFCQPEGSGVTITPPEGVFDDDEDEGEAPALDDARPSQATLNELRAALRRETVVSARLAAMEAILRAREQAAADMPSADHSEENLELVPRNPTAHFYEFDPNRKPAQRKRDNANAMDILRKIDAGEIDPSRLTPEEKAALAKYSGTGGALVGTDGKKGSAYEYYTPKPIAEGVWNLLGELGFAGGKVLDPCAGVGIFGATAPQNAAIDAVELNETSGRINGLVNDGPGYTTTVSAFERVAAATPDEQYDAVVTNVPFGEVADRGGNQLHDDRYQKEPLQNYFILRSLEKLRPGGLAIFITPPRCVSGRGAKEESLRVRASYMAEFLGAYRLPNSVFGGAGADTMTDVVAFRKYRRDMLEKIAELREQSPQTLIDAKVQWQPFIDGKYFMRDGRRFILGKFVPKDPNKFRDVDRVTTKMPVGEIGRMLKRFPRSRVDWEMLEATETAPLVYQDGDTITQAGQTLQMVDGRWVPLARTEESASMAALLGKLTDPYKAFESIVTWSQAEQVVRHMMDTAQAMDIPDWLRGAAHELQRLADDGARSTYWNAGIVGMAAAQVLYERLGSETGVNFLAEYPALSDAMQRFSTPAKKKPSALGGKVREGLVTITTHYNRKTGFSAVWRGDVATETPSVVITADGSFEGLRYKTKSKWVSMEDAKAIYGEAFDPMQDAQWCVSPDGKRVTRADDYYVGNYADFLRRVDGEIKAAANEEVRAKLLRQKLDADERLDKVDVTKIRFNLFTPYATLHEKAEFLRRFVDPSADVYYENDKGNIHYDKGRLDIRTKGKTDKEKLLNLFGDYLERGTISLGNMSLQMPDAQALAELRRMVNTANEQFNSWAATNRDIVARLKARASDPAKLRFRQVEDEAPIPIPGMNPELKLHGYQNAYVRKTGREFGGINGFGVGLGKTFTALAAVQYAHSIGVKKKTVFVVPNSVLSNWKKEVSRAYASTDDCLFVGLRVNKAGKATVSSAKYDEDLNAVLANRHSKIFLTMEAFERIRLKDETVGAYEQYMRAVDASFSESEDKKADERAKGKQAGMLSFLYEKKGGAPYLEDMGIDSLVMDEAHTYKNSARTVDFGGAKYLSLSAGCKRGFDAQVKAWYVRGKSPLKDGVLMLTATPITNSPLEIYSMLSLAQGHERVNDLCLGIKGADDFMQTFCNIVNDDDVTIDGQPRTANVFSGLNNLSVLRKAIGETATIKGAEDVGAQIVVPDRDERSSPVSLPSDVRARLLIYKAAFRFAIDDLAQKTPNRGSEEAFRAVQKHFGEPVSLIGHPFNLINKMTLLIADRELDERTTCYGYIATQADKAKVAIDAFNRLAITEERARKSPTTLDEDIVGRKTKKEDGKQIELLKIRVRARSVESRRISIDSIDPDTQNAFERCAEKAGLDLDVSVPPKLAAMLENFQHEQANPRGLDAEGNPSPIVKQIIFCDILALHNKIKRLLTKRAGVPASKIAIVTGRTNNEPDAILAVQDGFNAHGDENKYQVVIANEKAEVGINLQIGTQAIHHLTIGWTPDSIEQRNGRGARQGNKTGRVTIYQYDADGTFDTAKRAMVGKKAEWIGNVLDAQGGDSVSVSGGLSREQIEALIDSVGDGDAMRRMQETIAAKEAEARATDNRNNQVTNLATVAKLNAYLAQNEKAEQFVIACARSYAALYEEADKLRRRIDNPKATPTARANNENQLNELLAKLRGIEQKIDESATFRNYGHGQAKTIREIVSSLSGRGLGNSIVGELRRYEIDVIEDSAIANDWASEIDATKSMIEKSKASFMQQAGQKGGYPAGVMEAVAAGKGEIAGSLPLVAGMFAKLKDGTLAVVKWVKRHKYRAGDELDAEIVGRSPDGGYSHPSLNDVLKADAHAYPGSAEYDAFLVEAARVEDRLAAAGTVWNGYSEIVPEVAQRRTTEILAEYDQFGYKLPQPFYPYAVSPREAGASPLLRHIHESQKPLVRAWRNSYFIVPSDTEVEKRYGTNDPKQMAEYALAHGMKMTLADFGDDRYAKMAIVEAVDVEELKAALTGKTEAEILEQAASYIASRTRWFDWQGKNPARDYQSFPITKAIEDAVRKATEGDAPPKPELPTDLVGITGETFQWKNRIKKCAEQAGSKFYWDGRAATWNVTRAAWEKLVADFPQAAEQLILTEATRTKL
jgi:hypothetical protein